jgi:hypothetical protein
MLLADEVMPRSKKQVRHRDPSPENFNSLPEFWAFWDTHSTANYEDMMAGVAVSVDISSSKVYLCGRQRFAGTGAHCSTPSRGRDGNTGEPLAAREGERDGKAYCLGTARY